MTAIRIEDFGGRIPRRSNRLLPDNAAQIATDTKLFSGELRGWNTPLLRQTLAGTGIKTVFRIPNDPNDIWIESEYGNVHFQKGSLVNDTWDRHYWTSGVDDIPRYNTKVRIAAGNTGANAPFILGAPPPLTAPAGTATGGTSGLVVTHVFVYTFVSEFGEESAPSPPLTLTGQSDGQWNLTGLEVESDIPDFAERAFDSAGSHSGGTPATKRVYRTITSISGQTTFFACPDSNGDLSIPMSQTTFTTDKEDDVVSLSPLLESAGWNEPPPELEGLAVHPNGFLVGFVGRDLYFSVPYRPHAMPAEFVLSCDFEIMGLGIVGNTIGIATKSNPYGCTGIRPDAMALHKSSTVEPCLSKKGVVTLPTGVMYPSNNGLAWLTPAGAKVVTQSFMTKEEWQVQFKPEEINAARYETRYMAFNSSTAGFVYDPIEQQAAVVDLTRVNGVTDIYTDVYTGLVNLLEADRVFEWDPAGNTIPVSYLWKSRVFEFPKPLNMGAAILKFNDADFTADQDFIDLLEIANAAILTTIPPFKLGAINTRGFNSRRKVGVASYLPDLKNVFQAQSSAFNGSDLLNIAAFQAAVAYATVIVWADHREVYRHAVERDKIFRLPTGFKAHTYEIGIASNTDVYSVAMAEVPKELRTV